MDIKKVKRSEDYSQWYNNLVKNADLAEHSSVKGCMVIKPYGYAIWEKMQAELDKRFKATGHQNAYFPLFIPKSFFTKEASHVDGFAKECAVVTHYRLKVDEVTKEIVVDPDAKLEEELIVRPTSETIIWNTYRDWIKSYRDLPLLINQWANVVRWEMRTRLFLRTTEFLWQEGHTAHETADEAMKETTQMLDVYAEFAENILAVPVIKGVKTENERFAGALETYCIEGLMQDGKALQMGTSHFLGQNFAKAFDVKFLTKQNKLEHVWATSWGVSTRLMGALIMCHSDDEGLILPPNLAPIQVVIVPIYKTDEDKSKVFENAIRIQKILQSKNISVKLDERDNLSPGFKFAEHEMRGVPVRMAIGPRDVQNETIEVARRDTKEKQVMSMVDIENKIEHLLSQIQKNIFQKAIDYRDEHITAVDSWDEFNEVLENKTGFVSAHWDGTVETEKKIKDLTKATIRCIPLENKFEEGTCILTGNKSKQRVLFAKAY